MVVQVTTRQEREERNAGQRERERLAWLARTIRDCGSVLDYRPFGCRKTEARAGEITALADDPSQHARTHPAGEFFRHEYNVVEDDGQLIHELRIIPTPPLEDNL